MPDITMCDNNNCPIGYKCYRLKAEPDKYNQSYAHFEYDEEKGCEHFYAFTTAPDTGGVW